LPFSGPGSPGLFPVRQQQINFIPGSAGKNIIHDNRNDIYRDGINGSEANGIYGRSQINLKLWTSENRKSKFEVIIKKVVKYK